MSRFVTWISEMATYGQYASLKHLSLSLCRGISIFNFLASVFTYCKVLFTAICLIKSKTHLFCTLLHLHEGEALRTNIKVSILRFSDYAS